MHLIDPPYNTGNEGWAYNDNVNSPEIRRWLGDVVGKEGETLDRHDRWLCMMYPRLVLLKQFLREDGVLLMSLDSNEHRYAELLMDEVFGAGNRVETLVWKKSYGGGAKSKQVVNLHEYILCFARNKESLGAIELPPDENVLRYYKFKDTQFANRGPYRLQPLATNSMDPRPNLRYAIPFEGEEIWPEKQWQWSKERALAALANDGLVIRNVRGAWSVNYKQYLKDEDGEERASKLYSIIDGIYTQQGTNEIKDLFGDGKTFSFPKPPALIQRLIQAFTDKDSLILDSFAGSGTTGHAVLKQNAEDGGRRRFILVEMDGDIAQNVTSERVKRVASGSPTSRDKPSRAWAAASSSAACPANRCSPPMARSAPTSASPNWPSSSGLPKPGPRTLTPALSRRAREKNCRPCWASMKAAPSICATTAFSRTNRSAAAMC
ncbi:MAG: site-specific DNA-methyltransferase [Sulfurimicrobium sp.]|nr:site-specific DNA-methyltransferase [Sulfurimicrobium sp.]